MRLKLNTNGINEMSRFINWITKLFGAVHYRTSTLFTITWAHVLYFITAQPIQTQPNGSLIGLENNPTRNQ